MDYKRAAIPHFIAPLRLCVEFFVSTRPGVQLSARLRDGYTIANPRAASQARRKMRANLIAATRTGMSASRILNAVHAAAAAIAAPPRMSVG